ncbi:MAG TPA: type VI secretion protein [Scandinavium sp.]|jgi:hypothetical protein
MSWERTKATTRELSEAPSLPGWLLGGLLAIIVGVLLFVLHASGTLRILSGFNIWWLSMAPLLCWFFLFCLRGWLWGREVAEYQFLQKEAAYGQTQWEAWAERHLAVIGSCIFLPNEVSVACMHNEMVQQYGLTSRIDYLPEEYPVTESAINVLIKGIEKSINNLPKDLPFNITLLTDDLSPTVETSFISVWKSIFPERSVPLNIAMKDSLSVGWVEERLRQPVLDVDLLVILQLNGGEAYSDGLAALLLTSDDVAQKYLLPHSTRILRPMALDLTAFKDELMLFLETQTVACRSSTLFCDNKAWHEQFANLLTVGPAHNAPWKPEETGVLEKWIGIPGPSGAWLLAALIADVVNISKTPVLGLFTCGTDHFVSTITPGSEN